MTKYYNSIVSYTYYMKIVKGVDCCRDEKKILLKYEYLYLVYIYKFLIDISMYRSS